MHYNANLIKIASKCNSYMDFLSYSYKKCYNQFRIQPDPDGADTAVKSALYGA